MSVINKITIEEFCNHYRVETSFVHSLHTYGLIEFTSAADGQHLIRYDQLAVLERYIHLHYDLEINIEGLDAVSHLLNQIHSLQAEVRQLRNELGR